MHTGSIVYFISHKIVTLVYKWAAGIIITHSIVRGNQKLHLLQSDDTKKATEGSDNETENKHNRGKEAWFNQVSLFGRWAWNHFIIFQEKYIHLEGANSNAKNNWVSTESIKSAPTGFWRAEKPTSYSLSDWAAVNGNVSHFEIAEERNFRLIKGHIILHYCHYKLSQNLDYLPFHYDWV